MSILGLPVQHMPILLHPEFTPINLSDFDQVGLMITLACCSQSCSQVYDAILDNNLIGLLVGLTRLQGAHREAAMSVVQQRAALPVNCGWQAG